MHIVARCFFGAADEANESAVGVSEIVARRGGSSRRRPDDPSSGRCERLARRIGTDNRVTALAEDACRIREELEIRRLLGRIRFEAARATFEREQRFLAVTA